MRRALAVLALLALPVLPGAQAALTNPGDYVSAFALQGVLVAQYPDGRVAVTTGTALECALGGTCQQPYLSLEPGVQADGVWTFWLVPTSPATFPPPCAGPVCSQLLPADKPFNLFLGIGGQGGFGTVTCNALMPSTWTYDWDANQLQGSCLA